MSDLKNKIAGLLAKAESTDNEHERDAFTAKAEALMLKYGIEQAELEFRGKVKPEEITEVKMYFKSPPYKAIIPTFVNGICISLGSLRVLKMRGATQHEVYCWVIGHKTDVENAEMLINSLWNQGLLAVARWAKGEAQQDPFYRSGSHQEKWKARRAFLETFGYTVARRIKEEYNHEVKTMSKGAELVLVGRTQRVDEWTHTHHNVGKARRQYLHGGSTGYSAGRAAGERANIGNKSLGGKRGELS